MFKYCYLAQTIQSFVYTKLNDQATLVLTTSMTTKILLLSLIGIILRWGFLIRELILFIYYGLFVLILVVFFQNISSEHCQKIAVPDEHCQKIAVSNPTQAGQRFTWSKTWCDRQQLRKAVITGDTVTRLSIPIRGRGKSPEEGQGWNLAET